jgi:hypothetical protein
MTYPKLEILFDVLREYAELEEHTFVVSILKNMCMHIEYRLTHTKFGH